MTSFSATLRVAGQQFAVRHCVYEVHQATEQRGRVSARVRYEPVQLLLDVPTTDALLAWAAAPHQQQAAQVVFTNANGGSTLETLLLPAAYCVAYQEEFQAGDVQAGAYVCHLTLVCPAGWTIQVGGMAV